MIDLKSLKVGDWISKKVESKKGAFIIYRIKQIKMGSIVAAEIMYSSFFNKLTVEQDILSAGKYENIKQEHMRLLIKVAFREKFNWSEVYEKW